MSGEGVDRYEVEAMIRDALTDRCGSLEREIERRCADLDRRLRDLAGDLGSLERVVHARTDHLA